MSWREVSKKRTLSLKAPPSLLKITFLILIFVFISVSVPVYSEELLRVHFLDVGYGDAIFIQFPGEENMLIDSGDAVFGQDVIRYLKKYNIEKIDYVVMTHPHLNHFGGFNAIVESFQCNQFYINGDMGGDKEPIEGVM